MGRIGSLYRVVLDDSIYVRCGQGQTAIANFVSTEGIMYSMLDGYANILKVKKEIENECDNRSNRASKAPKAKDRGTSSY